MKQSKELNQYTIRGKHSKKGTVVFFRWLLIITCSYLILCSDTGESSLRASGVVLALLLSNLFLSTLPERLFLTRLFDYSLVLTDIVLITLGMWVSGGIEGNFFLLYFLVIMVAALSSRLRTVVFSCLLISAIYVAFALLQKDMSIRSLAEILMRVPFFLVVGVFYSYLVRLVQHEQSERVNFQKQCSLATRLRWVTEQLAETFERKMLLQYLAAGARDLASVSQVMILSRGEQKIVARAEKLGGFPHSEARDTALCNDLPQTLDKLEELVSAQIEQEELKRFTALSEQNSSEERADEPFQIHGWSLLPVRHLRQTESDLFLCLPVPVKGEVLEHLRLLTQSAALALENAGQYQMMLLEVESRKELIRQLSHALEYRTEFTANVSHEFRTPLYSLLGFVELFQEGTYGPIATMQADALQRIADNAQQLLRMVNDVLDFAKLESGKFGIEPTEGSLREFIHNVVDTCRPLVKGKSIHLNIVCESAVDRLIVDWDMLRQIVLNLLSNAIKFTEKGTVEIHATYDKRLRGLLVDVEDTGVGIDKARQQEIFEPFRQLETAYTKKFAGTGLGLAITKKQIELLGGDILVRSEPGRGTRFSMVVPAERVRTSEQFQHELRN